MGFTPQGSRAWDPKSGRRNPSWMGAVQLQESAGQRNTDHKVQVRSDRVSSFSGSLMAPVEVGRAHDSHLVSRN